MEGERQTPRRVCMFSRGVGGINTADVIFTLQAIPRFPPQIQLFSESNFFLKIQVQCELGHGDCGLGAVEAGG